MLTYNHHCRVLLMSVSFAAVIIACTAFKDEPMPLSQENVEKYMALGIEASRKIDPNVGTRIDKVIKLYRIPLEKKIGYSFDKTFRYWLVNRRSISGTTDFSSFMMPAIQAIQENLDEALRKGLISQRTYNFATAMRNAAHYEYVVIGRWDKIEKLLNMILEDQRNNNAKTCTYGRFLKLVLQSDILPQDQLANALAVEKERFPTVSKFYMLESLLDREVDFRSWGRMGLISNPDGTGINPSGMIEDESNHNREFVVTNQCRK